jgi:stage III sporulation protein AH
MIFSITKLNKKRTFFYAGIVILAIITVVSSNYLDADNQAKVDRTNAMQVTRQVASESALQVSAPDFFTEYRLERDKVRSERSDLIRDIIKNAKTDDMRQKAQESVLKMALDKQRESEMENLIKARGFADALVFVRENSVSAVVKTPTLSREEVIQVADAISRVTGVKPEDITISAKP